MNNSADKLPSGIEDVIETCWNEQTYTTSLKSVLHTLFVRNPHQAYQCLSGLRKAAKTEGFSKEFFVILAEALCSAFDVNRAFNNCERLAQHASSPHGVFNLLKSNPLLLRRLAAVLGGSQYLTDIFLQDPLRIKWLAECEPLDEPRLKDSLMNEWRQCDVQAEGIKARLKKVRLFKKKQYLRIGLRDLLRIGKPHEILAEISHVADICIQAVYEICLAELHSRYGAPMETGADGTMQPSAFAVIGLGKLGGGELNFSSDIDIMYLYSSADGETTGKPARLTTAGHAISNHDFYTRLSQAITNSLSEVTEDGNIFRVDLRLRPEGKKGDIAYPLRSYEVYYESWGETWERQALIKARTVAGDKALGRRFIEAIRPFVYRKYLDFTAIEEIRKVKERIDRNLISRQKDKDNIKLGYGGIREIEFIVQSLQIIYGGQAPELREYNTMRALDLLVQGDFLETQDAKTLKEAYVFLRELENRIQITFGLQQHIIPQNEWDQSVLARKMNIKRKTVSELAYALQSAYEDHAGNVRRIFEALFYYTKPTEELDINFEEEAYHSALEVLRRMAFNDPVHTYNQFYLLREGPPLVHTSRRSKQIFDRLIPRLIPHLRQLPDPDLAVNTLLRFVETHGSRESLYEFLLENENVASLLLTLFGNSKFLSDILIRSPESLGDNLNPEEWAVEKSREQLVKKLREMLNSASDWNAGTAVLRHFKMMGELHIGMRDFSYSPDISLTFKNLTELAEVYLVAALDISMEDLKAQYGEPRFERQIDESGRCELAIIGLGKLGGRELDYGSDLDLILVYTGRGMTTGGTKAPVSNYLFYNKLWQKFSEAASDFTSAGRGYKIDLRLRPEGKKGPVVQPLSEFAVYFINRAEDWERMALIKARPVAGGQFLGNAFMELASNFIYERSFTRETAESIRHIRNRMERELAKEREGRKDVKLGYGGIIDVDFIVQMLQLRYGQRHPEIRRTNTLEAIQGLHQIGVLSNLESAILQDAYQFLRRIENRLRIVQDKSINSFSSTPEEIKPLALRLGYKDRPPFSSADQLLEDYRRYTKNVRKIYNIVFQRLV